MNKQWRHKRHSRSVVEGDENPRRTAGFASTILTNQGASFDQQEVGAMLVIVDSRLAAGGSCEQLLVSIEAWSSVYHSQMQANLSVTCGGDVAELSELLRGDL